MFHENAAVLLTYSEGKKVWKNSSVVLKHQLTPRYSHGGNFEKCYGRINEVSNLRDVRLGGL